MKVFGYIRVSTEKQADKGQSLGVQRKKIQAYCDLYDLELVDIIADEGASAKNLDRDGIQSMLSRLGKKEANGVVVMKLDRLTRSMTDLHTLLDEVFDKNQLFSVQEQVDTRTPAGRLVLNILMSVAQWQREEIGKQVKQGMKAKTDKGEYTGGHAPLGWKKEKGSDELIPNKDEQELIEIVRDLRAKKLSYRKIAKEFKERQLKARKGHSNWSNSMIRRLDLAKTINEMDEFKRSNNEQRRKVI